MTSLLSSFHWLLGTLGITALLINTLGRTSGGLTYVATAGGLALTIATTIAFFQFGRILNKECGKKWLWFWVLTVLFQAFWAFTRAPLDVDGIFYHLTIALEALQKNQWGKWDFLLWQIQTTPKLGEIPNLCLISTFGFRGAQFGHFSTLILGTLGISLIAQQLGLKKSSLLGLVFFSTPILLKQMSANYVDIAVGCYWIALVASILTLQKKSIWVGVASFLLCGIKMNGLLWMIAALPLLLLKKDRKHIFIQGVLAAVLSLSFWAIPNVLKFNNPVFPLRPFAIFQNQPVLPPEIPVDILIGPASHLPIPLPLQWFCQFFLFEPIAQYDINSGAWGFVGLWALLALGFYGITRRPPLKGKFFTSPVFIFWLCLLLTFILTPGRYTPRYSILAGFIFIFPAWVLLQKERLSPLWKKTFFLALFLNGIYGWGERVLLRGTREAPRHEFLKIVSENFQDVVRFGEPQHPDRWMHFPYVPHMRKDEPRTVVVNEKCVDLTALYWGRHFKNRVEVLPTCRRWPF